MPHGQQLVRFVTSVAVGGDELAAAKDELVETMGYEALVDAAAVVANFHMMTRIADGTGTPLDAGTVDMSVDLRSDLGIDDLVSTRLPGS